MSADMSDSVKQKKTIQCPLFWGFFISYVGISDFNYLLYLYSDWFLPVILFFQVSKVT